MKLITVFIIMIVAFVIWQTSLIEIPNLLIATHLTNNSRIFVNKIWLKPFESYFESKGWKVVHTNDKDIIFYGVLVYNSSQINWDSVEEVKKSKDGKYLILDYECRGTKDSCNPVDYYKIVKLLNPNETVTLPPSSAIVFSDPIAWIINNVKNVYFMEYDESSSLYTMY